MQDIWYEAPKGNCHQAIFDHVRLVLQEQGDTFDRLSLLETLYDPYSPVGDDKSQTISKLVNVTENVIASNVDTTYASVATSPVRSRFLADDADWSVQRRAKKTERYIGGLGKQLQRHERCRAAFKESEKKGGGLVKVYRSRWDQPVIEHVRIEDVVVPDEDTESGGGPPLQLHHVQRNYDRDRLMAEYPEHADEIKSIVARTGTGGIEPAGYTRTLLARQKITVIESTRLPIGVRPKSAKTKAGKKKKASNLTPTSSARYVPGRRVICVDGVTLVDEPYHKPHHQFAVIVWSERQGSFYPISGSERIAGIQNALNKRNWQIDRILDQSAMVTTYVRPNDGHLTVKSTKIGNVVTYKGDLPQAPVLPAVHPEVYNSRVQLKESAFEEFGQSRLAAQSKIPAGLETGAAVREYRDSATQRFSPQEAAFEQLCLDADYLLAEVCKELGDLAPEVIDSRWRRAIAWSDVDLGQVKIQITAASTLPRTSAGREQTLMEWASAGIISTDSARRLMSYPDLDRELSMYTAALESIEETIEDILDGGTATPEPFDNLAMIEWRGTASYHNARQAGAPEDVLEALRDYITTAVWMNSKRQAPMNQNAAAAATGAPAPGGPESGPMSAGPPPGQTPATALAPEGLQMAM